MLENIIYHVPEQWYENVYKDKTQCRSGARSFSMIHTPTVSECWLFVHGYRGYPGEMVRPAVDLYNAGFDIFVPRLPGHGTCAKDFICSHDQDWLGVVKNAIADLKNRYKTVHLLGHSMGSSVIAALGCADADIGKLVLISPSFENLDMKQPARAMLKLLSFFTPRVRCKWHISTRYHQHYENAPCDEEYLGEQYWKWYFTKQLLEYYKIMKIGLREISAHSHEHLIINPQRDKTISGPSVKLYLDSGGNASNVVNIENGTHSVLYDKDPTAEEHAVNAVLHFACTRQTSK